MSKNNQQSGFSQLKKIEESKSTTQDTKSTEPVVEQPTQPAVPEPIIEGGELVILDPALLGEAGPADNVDTTEAPVVPPVDTSGQGEYKPPVVEELQPTPPPTAQGGEVSPPVKQPVENGETQIFQHAPAVLAPNEMVNANGTAASKVMLGRIDKHFKHLTGAKGFANNKERWEEQASFIECVGRSLGLSYDDYCLITEELITRIRDNIKLFTSGDCYRFMHDLTSKFPENNPVKYPKESAERYQAYMGFLVTIARNYRNRNRLRGSVDVTFATKDMHNTGKQNVTKFFNQLTSN